MLTYVSKQVSTTLVQMSRVHEKLGDLQLAHQLRLLTYADVC
jgi:hypothetical protein